MAAKPVRAKVARKKKGANGYQLPDPIPKGEILTDMCKKSWQIGSSIGRGGFGEIYSASEEGKRSTDLYVVKIEPHENGPLFVEMHFYMKVCKADDVDKWIKSKKLHLLGLPCYVASGSHMLNGKKHRFLVMERFGKDLWTVFLENKKIFPYSTVLKLGIQILNVLEYIHSKGYVHADVKGSNLLLGLKKGSERQVYLVDFGLASHYAKDYRPDPKCAHNGTIEYTSRDAHVGVSTRRGDLEVLAYNLLHWSSSRLPWENKLTNCSSVHQEKVKYMDDIPVLMKKCFMNEPVPDALNKYFKYVANLAHDKEPDYELCRRLFKEGLKACGTTLESKLEFSSPPATKKSVVKAVKESPARKGRKVAPSDEEDNETSKARKSPRTKKIQQARKPRIVIPDTDDEEEEEEEDVDMLKYRVARSRRNIANGRSSKFQSSLEEEESSHSDEDFAYSSRPKKRGSDGAESRGKKSRKGV